MVLLITASCLEEIRVAEETVKSRDDPQWQQHQQQQQLLQQQSSRGADGISDADVSSMNMSIQSVIHEEDLIPIYDR
jgi:outer membrane biogenesis lipoprotein LolB